MQRVLVVIEGGVIQSIITDSDMEVYVKEVGEKPERFPHDWFSKQGFDSEIK